MKTFNYIGSRVAGYLCLLVFAALCVETSIANAQALTPGQVVGWGNAPNGQATIPAGLTNASAIAAAVYHSLALREDGTVTGWGNNSDGQITIPAGLTGVTAIAAGVFHSLALRNGTVVGWGNNTGGQVTIPAGLANVTAIAAGYYHSLALSNGTVVGWGDNDFGQSTFPAGLLPPGRVVTAIAAGNAHSIALLSDGTVVGWGDNSFGQSTFPTNLILAGRVVTAIAAGNSHSIALLSDGTVVGWGYNSFLQTTIPDGLTNVIAVAAGAFFSVALQSSGTVVIWGKNEGGQLAVPVNLTGAATGVNAVAAGGFYALAANLVPLQATTVPFASFTPTLPLSNKNAFAFGAVATVAPNGAAFNPQIDTVTLTMNATGITIPPNSFKLEGVSYFVFKGMIGNVKVVATVIRQGSNKYLVGIGGTGANFTPVTNPVAVKLIIGTNTGSKSVKPLITK
jgi:hypothetical protein